ncbi:hypothetical protein V2J09_019172 [Rumex salicifolius]
MSTFDTMSQDEFEGGFDAMSAAGVDGSTAYVPPSDMQFDPSLSSSFTGNGGEDDVSHSDDPYGFNSAPSDAGEYAPSPFESAEPEENGAGKPLDEGLFSSDGPSLPPPDAMQPEQGSAFREWRRQNAIHLEEKEKKEKEMRAQILEEAEEYKRSFYEKRNTTLESTKSQNREREKLYLSNQEKFHKEAHNHYWKAISEIIPHEVPNIERRRGRKTDEKKPSVVVVQGPKPGKPTDLTRMRHIFIKLKQKPPAHMMPPPPPKDGKDTKNEAKDAKKDADNKENVAANGKSTSDPKDATQNGNEEKPKPVAPVSEGDGMVKEPEPASTA